MVKPPRTRHSKSRKDPVTIDLDPADVKREADERESSGPAAAAAAESAAEPGADQTIPPNAADEALADDDLPPRADQPERAEPAEASPPRSGAATEDADRARARDGRASTALAAGVAGAVIALLGAAALQWTGALPAPQNEPVAADAASLEALRADIEAMRQEADEGEAADPALAQSLAQTNARIEQLGATVEQLRGDLAAVGTPDAEANSAALQALEARLAELEAAAGASQENAASLEGINQRLAELAEGSSIAAAQSGAQGERLDALEEQIFELGERVAAQAAEPGMAMAIAATALKSAIDRGTPFMTELETYAAIAPDMPQITALRDMAASGVPTRAEIEEDMTDAAGQMMAATAAPPDPNAGFVERMFTSAQSLVEVRPVGSVEGEGPGATVARMEAAVRQGDYARAVEEFETLPPAAQEAGREFVAKLEARMAADRLIAEALAGAVQTPEQQPTPLPQDEG